MAGRDRDYIWRGLWTGLSVYNRSVTGSLTFGSSQRLGRCCLWLAGLSFRWIGSAEVPLCHHLLPAVTRNASHEVEIHWFLPLYRHPVWPDGEIDRFYSHKTKKHTTYLIYNQYMVCAGLQQSHRMTVNPGRIVAINVIQYTWGRCLPIIMMYYNIYIENWNKK